MELLAPAGGPDSLPAAVYTGADAVYLGLSRFSARASAKNFDRQSFRQAVEFCHSFAVSVYVALNTVYTDSEREEVASCIRLAAECGADALIVQDIGIAALAKQIAPSLPLHGSTQMSIHTPAGARQLRRMGFARVVAAREMSVQEIQQLCETGMEVEVFVHGALCFCVSGQCMLSSMLGGRSANRGACAQPCRLPFSAAEPGRCDLSLKDLCALPSLRALQAAGVRSLKIEGRMKRPEYVAAATHAVRTALDGGQPDLQVLQKVFSRSGFTNGYLEDRRDGGMFGTRSKEDAPPDGLYAQLRQLYRAPKPRRSVGGRFLLQRQQPARLTLTAADKTAVVEGQLPSPAQHAPLTEERARAQLGKLGGTPFFLEKLEVQLQSGLYLPPAELNRMRRQAVEQLLPVYPPHPVYPTPPLPNGNRRESGWALRLECRRAEQIVSPEAFELIALDVDELLRNQKELRPLLPKLAVLPPRVFFGQEQRLADQLRRARAVGVQHLLVNNLGQLPLADGFILHGAASLNITNSDSAAALRRMGFADCVLSPECRLDTAARISNSLPRGLVVAGRLPLMISRSCPVKRVKGCAACGGNSSLTDRKGKRFELRCKDGIVEIFNPDLLWMADRQAELSGLSFGVLQLALEDRAQAEKLVQNFIQNTKPDGFITRGLYYRGI